MSNENMTIGILGGMGSLAASAFLTSLVRAFPGEKEWDRPRTVLDNACHMPSRVRAILYGEHAEELTQQMAQHMAGLVNLGCTDIVLCCNTSHAFLPKVLPLAQQLCGEKPFTVHHIIRILGESLRQKGISHVSLLATEGTLDVGIYPSILQEYGVTVDSADQSIYPELRYLIEAVKQNKVDDEALSRFIALVNNCPCPDVVLGCTEFPIFQSELCMRASELCRNLHDPLQATIQALAGIHRAAEESVE